MRRVHGHIFITIALLAGLLAAGGCAPTGLLIKPVVIREKLAEKTVHRDEGFWISDKVVVIDIDGVIMNQRSTSMFSSGENPVSLFIEKIDKAEKDCNVKALILRINSPGGGVTATDIMYRRLMRFKKERNVPVIAVIEDVGASGGYYLACGADKIVAHPTSITGSIGVIVQTLSFAGTMQKIGLTSKAITSGPRKDMASPLKPLDPEDEKILQSIVDDFYGRFVAVVDKGRPSLSTQRVKTLADGRIYTAAQAQDNGLVDMLGDMNDVIELAKKQSGVSRARVVIYDRPMGYRANVYSQHPNVAPQINLINITAPDLLTMTQPQIMYLWTRPQ